ncbi:kynureninase [Lujinxingia litoralis]|uniref:Kynureninase n=1 Tax=Lujinxingia litoralis TaxID=2211119 RepID=A0A328C6Y1_9DELT|nr:kynureninase [Lujinxingia litoralis]RAL22308.1 kynureninase [Lujinxingia litoralis]
MKLTDLDYARQLDREDPLRDFRQRFHIPTNAAGEPVLYLCGNSLGLQPRGVTDALQAELEKWARLGVDGHFAEPNPWYSYHEIFNEPMASVVGARPEEVVVMNSLTTNLHLLMVSFYRPTPQRYKILIEGGAFPSDLYAVQSQARVHGFEPDDAIVELFPRQGEKTLRQEDIEAAIAREGDALALVLFGGVNYYTGQLFDMGAITEAGHRVGALVGFDLAHAAGNVPLKLHQWGPDFAAWCSYKYLNSGPGGVAGVFVHERHLGRADIPRFEGWWGTDPSTRFEMGPRFQPQAGAGAWQLSNAPVLPMAALKASLELFCEAGMQALHQKSARLTGYLHELVTSIGAGAFEVITPAEPEARGCQLSILASGDGELLHQRLMEADVICDYRRPNVIRVAPTPLYNTFEEVWRFWKILEESVS